MAVRTSVSRSRRFSSALSSAAFEWVLILFLFVEASFSFLVTRFSRRCKLQAPCIVCSRLDHVLGSEQPGFYRDLICNAHKLEISSLAFCHLHQKLADVATMCEACFLSFATEKKSNAETFRSLVGKVGLDHSLPSVQDDNEFQGDDAAKAPLLKNDVPSSSSTRICSCCSSPFRHKPHTLRLAQDKAIGVDVGEEDYSMASLPEPSNLCEESKLDKIMEWPVTSSPTQHTQDKSSDHFPNVEYTQEIIASDPEIPLSRDNNENAPDAQFDSIKEVSASLGDDTTKGDDSAKAPLLKDDMPSSSSTRICSYCSSPFKHKPHTLRLVQDKAIGVDVGEEDYYMASVPEPSNLGEESKLDKIMEWPVTSSPIQHTQDKGSDHFPSVEYTQVKIALDPEIPLSHDNNENAPDAQFDSIKEVFASIGFESEPITIEHDNLSAGVTNYFAPEEQIHPPSLGLELSEPILNEQLHENRQSEMLPCSSPREGPEDIDQNLIEQKANALQVQVLTKEEEVSNTKDISEFSDVGCITTTSPVADMMDWSFTEVNLKTSHTVSEPGAPVSNQMDLYDTCKLAVGTRENSLSPTFTDLIVKRDSFKVHEELKLLTSQVSAAREVEYTEVNLKTSHTVSEPGSSFGNQMDLYDAYKLAVGTRESSMSPTFTDLIVKRDSLKVHEELKLLISQVSAARGVESPWHELSPSPRVYGEGEETILQNISKRLEIERNESGFESLDGSIVSEIDGESALERLKRQIELDRKSISLLYKELEEERNASSIAANQAMAMITKLQEEKAAMQMEALQYQRMMEEQAEYEQESLRMCNEQLTEKEKQIQDLEAALESLERSNGKSSLVKVPERRSTYNKTFDEEHDYGSNFVETDKISKEFMETELGILKHPLLCFEDEKAYISNCLSNLEKKLHLFSNNGIRVDVSSFDDETLNGIYVNVKGEDDTQSYGVPVSDAGINGQHTAEHPHDLDSSEGKSQGGGFLAEEGPDGIFSNALLEDCMSSNSLSERKLRINGQDIDEATIMEIFPQENSQEREFLQKEGSFLGKEWPSSKTSSANENNSRNKKESVDSRYDFMTLDNEVSHLRQRLEVLELDRDFLEHAINTLKNGEDGVQFIQEIACELQELRRNGILRRVNPSA